MTLIEFTQNADLTYRLYDYDRIDPVLGTKRQLHIQEVFDNIRLPNSDTAVAKLTPIHENGLIRTMLHEEPGVYTAEKLDVETKASFRLDEFYFLTILEGQGTINTRPVKAGETVFVPCAFGQVEFEGKLQMAYVTYKERGKQ
jgi:mannose-6-phosphate isomerase